MIKMNKRLERFALDLYNIFQIHLSIFDMDFKLIAEIPEYDSAFCRKIMGACDIRSSKCLCKDVKACIECSKLDGDIFTYKCHAGLGGAICPIRYNNMTLGYIHFKQFIDVKDEISSQNMLFDLSMKYNLELNKLSKLWKKLKVIQYRQISAMSHIVDTCASYIWGEQILFSPKDYYNKLDRYISENISKNMTILEIAQELNMSKSSVYKLSQEVYSMPLAKYIRNKRMDMAKELLESSIIPIYRVANMIGYEDFSHFSKVFKSYTGTTPSRFRQKENL